MYEIANSGRLWSWYILNTLTMGWSTNLYIQVKKNNMKLIKFYANWCGPCKAMVPIIDSVKSRIKVHEIDVDEVDPLILTTYKVKSIPLLIIEDSDSNVLWRHEGIIKQNDLHTKLDELNLMVSQNE